MPNTSEIVLLRNQVKTLLQQLQLHKKEETDDISNDATDLAYNLLKNAKNLFDPDEIRTSVGTFDRDHVSLDTARSHQRIRVLIMAMDTLLSYIDTKIGDPVAVELITNTIDKAKETLKDGHTICAVLLCRIALEQSLRRLCDKLSIEYAFNEPASRLLQKLREPNGPLVKGIWKEADARLTKENEIIHGDIQTNNEETLDIIHWTERFISKYLEKN